jgi:hypothetical protein
VRPAAVLLLTSLAACTRGEPPAPRGSPSVAEPMAASVPPPVLASGAPSTAPSVPPLASAPVDPSLLPQTRDRPDDSGTAFDGRVSALWDAIVADDPARAMPFFFPLGAYRQVKDISDPASDWSRRLVAAYSHDIHALHARLGDDAPRAKLVRLDVPQERARWVEPGEEYNKIGYYRVFGSRLRYAVDGAPHAIEVKSLISWRGEWYVVHLSAIE